MKNRTKVVCGAALLLMIGGCATTVKDPVDWEAAEKRFPSYSHALVGLQSRNIHLYRGCGGRDMESVVRESLMDNAKYHSNGLIASSGNVPITLRLSIGMFCRIVEEGTEHPYMEGIKLGLSIFAYPLREDIRYNAAVEVAIGDDELMCDELAGVVSGSRTGFHVGALVAWEKLYLELGALVGKKIAYDIIELVNQIDFVARNAGLTEQEQIERAISFLKSACVSVGRTVEIQATSEFLTVAAADEAKIRDISSVRITEREGFDRVASEFVARESVEIRKCMKPYIDRVLSKLI